MLLDVTRKSFTDVQRSFVYPAQFRFMLTDNPANLLISRFDWKNSGNTPTRDLSLWLNSYHYSKRIGETFSFPDFQTKGQTMTTTLLGPQSDVWSTDVASSYDISLINSGNQFVYVWGWGRYRDVFDGTAMHLTRSCLEIYHIEITQNPQNQDQTQSTIFWRPCERGNCADEECVEQHIPFPPNFIDAPALSAPPVITHPLPTIEAPPHDTSSGP